MTEILLAFSVTVAEMAAGSVPTVSESPVCFPESTIAAAVMTPLSSAIETSASTIPMAAPSSVNVA